MLSSLRGARVLVAPVPLLLLLFSLTVSPAGRAEEASLTIETVQFTRPEHTKALVDLLDLVGQRPRPRPVSEEIVPDRPGRLQPLRDEEDREEDEPDALAFRLFRTGITWADRPTVERIAEEARLGTTVVWAYRETSTDVAAAPAPLIRAWLIVHTREVTSEVDARAGRSTGLRVFVAGPPS